MATIRERGGKFHVQVRMSGFPSRTGSFPTRRQAERWAKTIEAEMIEGRHFRSAEARRRTVGAAIDRFIEDELPKKKDQRNPKIRLLWWKERIGHLRLADVTPAVIVEQRGVFMRQPYKRAKPESKRSTVKGEARTFKRSAKTWNRYHAALSKLFTVARKEWHWASHNPFDGVAKHAEGRGRIRVFVGDEQARLFAQTSKDHQLHTLTVCALSTAPRAGELTRLEWPDVDLETGRVLLRDTKNGEPRTAWLVGEALRLLREHHERCGKPAAGRVFQSKTGKLYRYHTPFKAAVAAAKITNFVFHDLRHCSATFLAREGATNQQLKAIGGWKSDVVNKYVHLVAEDAKSIVQKMNEKVLGK